MKPTILLLTALLYAPLSPMRAADAQKPTIVMIISDHQGASDSGCYDNPDV
ncbi:MAG: hypothetical protein SGI77_05920 [Pirellulaceae bacterium]|nr:hypothetical protein [Pirellulaceae bacterium]